MYICDVGNHHIQVFITDGEFCHSIVAQVDRGLQEPSDVATDLDGNLHVMDHASDSVLVFSPEGVLLRSCDCKQPSGIVINPAGYSMVYTKFTREP